MVRRHQFRRKGSVWEVVFEGRQPFCMNNTLDARYLNFWLHRPNESFPAFDLEVGVQPEKAEARARNSIQEASDARTRQECRQAWRELRAEKEEAQAAGDLVEARRIDEQIREYEKALKRRSVGADTAERARINVRKAVAWAIAKLKRGGPDERAFAEYLQGHLSTGYECLYWEPRGRIWD